jgi:hypothetical protein
MESKMMETIWSMAQAMAGMFIVLGGWILVQGVVRRGSGCTNPNRDVLDFMLHGCSGTGGGACNGKGGCHSGKPANSKLR